MNIFYLDHDPVIAAEMMCDTHCSKMIVEAAQMLSTAHRILDGVETRKPSKSGKRMVKAYEHPTHDDVLYAAVHHNHPSTVWTREALNNYNWHYRHFRALGDQFELRFGKQHATIQKLSKVLATPPKRIPNGSTPIRKAMAAYPHLMDLDGVTAYREFYWLNKRAFAKWEKGIPAPEWWLKKVDEEHYNNMKQAMEA